MTKYEIPSPAVIVDLDITEEYRACGGFDP